MRTKGIEFVAPLTLGIYMFHLRSPMWDILTAKGIDRLAGQNIIVFTLCITALAICIFVIGAVVEWIRQRVYDLLHINVLFYKLIGLG